jgi:hypothetical protein
VFEQFNKTLLITQLGDQIEKFTLKFQYIHGSKFSW